MSAETRQKLAEVLRDRKLREERERSMSANRDVDNVKAIAEEVMDHVSKRAKQTVDKFMKTEETILGAFDVADKFADELKRTGADLHAMFGQLSNLPPPGDGQGGTGE